jgi:HEAT repeat protein
MRAALNNPLAPVLTIRLLCILPSGAYPPPARTKMLTENSSPEKSTRRPNYLAAVVVAGVLACVALVLFSRNHPSPRPATLTAQSPTTQSLATAVPPDAHSASLTNVSAKAATSPEQDINSIETLTTHLKDPAKGVAAAAARKLGELGTPEAALILGQLLNDTNASPELRSDAAMALGEINQPGVTETLAQAARTIQDEDIVTAIISALGSRDFSETQPFFQEFLHSPDVSSELRVAAAEALAGAKGDPTAFLADLAADSDTDVRVAAAWAMSATEVTGNAGPQVLGRLQNESEGDVRLRLYQALRNQEGFDTSAALGLVQNEKDPSARVAGLDLMAKLLRDSPTPELQDYFSKVAIPELKQTALTAENFDDRQSAVIALTRAHSADAMTALKDIGNELAAQKPPAAPPPVPERPRHPPRRNL